MKLMEMSLEKFLSELGSASPAPGGGSVAALAGALAAALCRMVSALTAGKEKMLSQTFRSLIYSRMRVGMERYSRLYPDADVVLFEPARDDPEMFFTNIFSYSDRRRLCEHAYQRTREDLRRRADELEPVLARHGVSIDRDVLADASRRLSRPRTRARRSPARTLDRAATQLAQTLDVLEHALAGAQPR